VRAGKIKKARTAARFETPLAKSLSWQFAAPEMRPPSDLGIPVKKIVTQKSPRPISRRGLFLFLRW
jgi:hypothetical protein